MGKIKNLFSTVSSRQGSYSLAMTAVVIGIVVFINLIAGRLPSSLKQIDISTNNIYEITDTSRDLLKDLDKDVDFTILAEKSSTDERIRTFIEKYAALSSHINVEWIDPVLHPSALTEYETESDTIVVSCSDTEKTTTVSFQDIITYDEMSYYTTGSLTESEFDGEGQLTSAVNYVTTDVSKTIYTVSGHGESSLPSSVTDLMKKSSFTTEELNLLTSYMENGGNVFFIQGEELTDMPNFSSLMETYGLQPSQGYIADMQRSYQGNYYYIFPLLSVSEDLAENIESQMVLLVNAHGFTEETPARDTITLTPFMTTSSNSYAVTEDGDTEEASYVLGAVATENDSRFTVISSASMIDETITSQFTNIENLSLFMNAITANFDDVENLSIEAKSLQLENNTMQYTGLIGIVAIVGIPVIFLIYGLWQWMKRRKA